MKDAGALLPDDDVAGLGSEFVIDGVAVGGNESLASGRLGAGRAIIRPRLLGTIEDGDAGAARRCEQPLGRRNRPMRVDAAGVGIARVDLVGRKQPAAIDEFVEIDREQRRTRTDEGLASPAGIKLLIGRRNDLPPAMVVEFVDGGHPPLRGVVSVLEG